MPSVNCARAYGTGLTKRNAKGAFVVAIKAVRFRGRNYCCFLEIQSHFFSGLAFQGRGCALPRAFKRARGARGLTHTLHLSHLTARSCASFLLSTNALRFTACCVKARSSSPPG